MGIVALLMWDVLSFYGKLPFGDVAATMLLGEAISLATALCLPIIVKGGLQGLVIFNDRVVEAKALLQQLSDGISGSMQSAADAVGGGGNSLMAMLDDANGPKKKKKEKALSKSLIDRNIKLKEKKDDMDSKDAVREYTEGKHRTDGSGNTFKPNMKLSAAARAKAERRASSGLGSSTLRRNSSSNSLHSNDSQESNDRGSFRSSDDRGSDKGSFRSSSSESFRGGGGKDGASFRRGSLSKKTIDDSAFPFIDAALQENADLFKVARHLVHRGLNEQRCIKEAFARCKERSMKRAMKEAFECFRPDRAFIPTAQLARLASHLNSPSPALGLALAAAGMHHSAAAAATAGGITLAQLTSFTTIAATNTPAHARAVLTSTASGMGVSFKQLSAATAAATAAVTAHLAATPGAPAPAPEPVFDETQTTWARASAQDAAEMELDLLHESGAAHAALDADEKAKVAELNGLRSLPSKKLRQQAVSRMMARKPKARYVIEEKTQNLIALEQARDDNLAWDEKSVHSKQSRKSGGGSLADQLKSSLDDDDVDDAHTIAKATVEGQAAAKLAIIDAASSVNVKLFKVEARTF